MFHKEFYDNKYLNIICKSISFFSKPIKYETYFFYFVYTPFLKLIKRTYKKIYR